MVEIPPVSFVLGLKQVRNENVNTLSQSFLAGPVSQKPFPLEMLMRM